MSPRRWRAVFMVSMIAHVSLAQTPAQVLDINPSTAPNSSSPTEFVIIGGIGYFAATTISEGTELWRTDGTSGGTSLVKDILPGYAGSNPSNLTPVGSELFFTADDGTHGTELWKSDGTSFGTVLVKDVTVGANGSYPQLLINFGGQLAFFVQDATQWELWLSDGSAAGTALLTTQGWTSVASPVICGANLCFIATTAGFNNELWRTNGTVLGTVRISSINPANGFAQAPLAVWGSTLFFAGNDGTAGNGSAANELWRSDGTGGGTQLVLGFGARGAPSQFVVAGGDLFFADATLDAGAQVWMTNGSTNNATIPKNICANPDFCPGLIPALGALGSNAYFAQLALPTPGDWELWQVNASSSTQMRGFATPPTNLTASTALLFFVESSQLWRTDGTAVGTVPLGAPSPSVMTGFGSQLLFSADNGVIGREPWLSGGGVGDTQPIKDLAPGIGSSNPVQLLALNDQLLFVADDGTHGYQLWRSDGGSAGTNLVLAIGSQANPGPMTAAGNTVFFSADDGVHGRELWKSDGTGLGTSLVKDISAGASTSGPSSLTALGSTLFFAAEDGILGRELWKSDGTTAGTVMVADLRSGGGSDPSDLTTVAGAVFFTADDGVHGRELWKTDATVGATVLVSDIAPGGAASSPTQLTAVGSMLLFSADDGTGRHLWRSDGTPGGTQLVKRINAGGSSTPLNITALGSTVFFSATDGVSRQLWKSDGTTAGTVLVKQINPAGDANPSNLTAVDGSLFLTATDAAHGTELWESDGTLAGTVLVKDIAPGPTSSSPTDLFGVGAQLYFSASGQLWTSDGTSPGTVALGPSSLAPGPFQAIPNTLLFGGTNPLGSRELWGLTVDTTPPGIAPNLAGTPGANGWYVSNVSLSFTVTDPQSGVRSTSGCDGGTVTEDTPDASFVCRATSAGGTSSRLVVVQRDTTAPRIRCPPDLVAEASSPSGAAATFAPAIATDNLDPAPQITYSTASGDTFPLGIRAVTATATDRAGNGASCSFNVTVRDTTPPQLTCPKDVFVDNGGAAAAVVTLPAPAVGDLADMSPLVTYSPPNGSSFALGETPVTVTATDHSGNQARCTFIVRVGCVNGTCPGTGKKKSQYAIGCSGCSATGSPSPALLLFWGAWVWRRALSRRRRAG